MDSAGVPALEPRRTSAGQREAGVACARCAIELNDGEPIAVCRDCGAVHHGDCWKADQGCSAYDCVKPTVSEDRLRQVAIRITSDELRSAIPLRPAVEPKGGADDRQRSWNRASVWAMVIALLGVPLFGLITGFVAMVVACVALVNHRPHQRGVGVAVSAMVLGLADIVGWGVGLSHYMGGGAGAHVAFAEMAIDDESLDELPKHIARAMRANVMVNAQMGIGRAGIGSGVVLRIADGLSYIVTNRHVIDGAYTGSTTTAPTDLSGMARLTVGSIGAMQAPASVVWVAPHGIDLALLTARFPEGVVDEAHWNADEPTIVGDNVFAIGNPHGLGWTHTSGSISQVRRQSHGGYDFRLIQTSAAINSGNSGGGLYDSVGRLIGVNTMTAEKRFAEGLGFSIAYDTLIDLIPEKFGILRRNPDANPTETRPAP